MDITKVCTQKECPFEGVPQSIQQFSRDKHTKDGYHPHCKTCRTRANQRWRKTEVGRESLRKASERYRTTSHGKERIKSHYLSEEYREKINPYQREYAKRPEVKLKLAIKRANYVTRNRLKEHARHALNYAVSANKIIKPSHCEWCKVPATPEELEAHHWRGYDPVHWLDVKFVHSYPCHVTCENVSPENWP